MATTFNIQVEMTFNDLGTADSNAILHDSPADFSAFLLAGCERMITEELVEWPPVITSTPTSTVITMKVVDEAAYYRLSPTVDAICNVFGKNFPTRVRTDL